MPLSARPVTILVIMRVDQSSSFACVLLFSIKITVGIGYDEFKQAQGNCTFLKIGHYRTAAVSTPSDSISCNSCYNEVFENTSCLCISDMLQLLENCCSYNFTSMLETRNQTLCIVNTDEESESTLAERKLIIVILGSLLGFTTLLLAVSIAALIGFITANVRLKVKLKQFARSHSRLNKHRKEEHTIHNPVYCDTQLKSKEPQKRVHLSNQAEGGKYSLAGPGMPYEIADIDDF